MTEKRSRLRRRRSHSSPLDQQWIEDWRERKRRQSTAAALDDLRRDTWPALERAGVNIAALDARCLKQLGYYSPLPQPQHAKVKPQIEKLGESLDALKTLAEDDAVPYPMIRALEAVAVNLSDTLGIGFGQPLRNAGAPDKRDVLDFAEDLEKLLQPLQTKRYQRIKEILEQVLPAGYRNTSESLKRLLRKRRNAAGG